VKLLRESKADARSAFAGRKFLWIDRGQDEMYNKTTNPAAAAIWSSMGNRHLASVTRIASTVSWCVFDRYRWRAAQPTIQKDSTVNSARCKATVDTRGASTADQLPRLSSTRVRIGAAKSATAACAEKRGGPFRDAAARGRNTFAVTQGCLLREERQGGAAASTV
jgi:hypothetical protein